MQKSFYMFRRRGATFKESKIQRLTSSNRTEQHNTTQHNTTQHNTAWQETRLYT
jgi:hypothetical protein